MSLYEYFVVVEDEKDLETYTDAIATLRSVSIFSGGMTPTEKTARRVMSDLGNKYPIYGEDADKGAVMLGRPWTGEGEWADASEFFDYGTVYTLDAETIQDIEELTNGEAPSIVQWMKRNRGKRFILVNDNEW